MTDGHTDYDQPLRHQQDDRRWRGRRPHRRPGRRRRRLRRDQHASSTPSSSASNANPADTGIFTAHTRIVGALRGPHAHRAIQSMGLFIGTGDQDNYAKVVLTANGGSPGVQFVEEVGGSDRRPRRSRRSRCPVPTRSTSISRSTPPPQPSPSYRVVQRERGTAARAGHRSDPTVWCTSLAGARHRHHRHVHRRSHVPGDLVGPRGHVGIAPELTRPRALHGARR